MATGADNGRDLDNGNGDGAANAAFDELLRYLKRTRGFDFGAYKRASLMRRVDKRMQLVGLSDFAQYTDYLEVHPEEFQLLFNHILINVTQFYRDEPAWDFLKREVVPKIIESKKPEEHIRVWSAGCASGQEPYSLAMMFEEALGAERTQQIVKIYASDIDEDALTQARHGIYTAKDVDALDPGLRKKYFEESGGRFVFRNDLRRAIIFGRHDLVSDAPISRLDLLVCRNTLMYFNAETQNRILARFHFALNEDGYLFLGKAEMLLTHVNLFSPVDLKCRIFKKVMKVTLRERLQLLNQIGDEDNGTRLTRFLRLRDLSTESIPIAQLIVDGDGELAYANERARLMFALTARDIGKPFRDLEVSYRPIELRSLIEQAFTERRMVTKAGIERNVHDQAQHLDVEITPLLENGATVLGCSITFQDVTRVSQLQAEVQRSKQELETAYEELQSTNEELETTNEELQSTVEELETTNEELQSTNEELETMNEELQSTNEELQSVNTELRERTDELNRATHFQESILASLEVGVVVVDAQLHVLIWNRQMTDLWGLREEEVKGKSLIEIEMGLPVERMLDRLQHCVRGEAGGAPVTVSAVNRRGKTITCRILCSPLSQTGSPPTGAIVLVEDFSQAEASGPKASNH